DVAPDRWSYDAIEWAFEAGIAEADEDGNFCPADPLARADMAVMFVKAENLTEMAENTFSDLDGHPAADDILKAVHAGIFEGYPDGTFDPNGSTNRYEAVTALVRYLLGGEPTDDMWQSLSITFTDVPSSHWAYKYVVLAVNGYVGVPK
ncbi:MAG: S-layer homology domain-containing protein, partial [Clostridiales bacterium]|nr:S-layer homology domain-containing protein [Clostridiales bacterium]